MSDFSVDAGEHERMERHARLFTRVASAGLTLVFVALIICTLWGTAKVNGATAQTLEAVTLSQRYELLERQLSAEASLVRVHGFDPAGTGWNEERPASMETENTLAAIAKVGSVRDREIADATSIDHDQYLDILLILFSQIDNDTPGVTTTFKKAFHTSERMLKRIDSRAAEQHRAATTALANLASTESIVVRTTLLASIFGLALVSICLVVIARYRRMMDVSRESELLRLSQASLTDTVTGLGNHRAYQEELEREFARIDRHTGSVTLALIDIDNFKNINDSMGHIHGDGVLATLGELLRSLRKCDRSFRLGGDEFAVVLPHTNTSDAVLVMERLRGAASSLLGGSTISVGISTMDGNALDPVTLRAQADGALYAAKHHGRDRVMTYQAARDQSFVRATEKARALRQLIDEGRLDVVFQPIWDVRTQRPLGFEALVRPAQSYGLCGPQEAFDIAEQMGLAPALDTICLRAIFAHARELPKDALLFVNIVPESLDSDFLKADRLVAAAAAAGLSPHQVVIELTERSMQRFDIIVRESKRLQSLGFQIALDDTGAGNAGLDVLRRLSVDFVKLDRMVVVQSMTDPIANAILSSLIDIARAMGSYVIAEGIETLDNLTFICSHLAESSAEHAAGSGVQGYLLGRPESEPWTQLNADAPSLISQASIGLARPSVT